MYVRKSLATEIETDLRKLLSMDIYDKEQIKYAADHIASAEHFSISSPGGKLINDDFKGLIDTTNRLPFKSITIEVISADTNEKILILATEETNPSEIDGRAIIGISFRKLGIENMWVPYPYAVIMPTQAVTEIGRYSGHAIPFLQEYLYYKKTELSQFDKKHHEEFAEATGATILELCEALSCNNVFTKIKRRASERQNKKREKKGLPPIYETKLLMITIPRKKTKSSSSNSNTRNSPREHLRRGHIRNHPHKGKIWINSAVINPGHYGRIDKDYCIRLDKVVSN